GLELDAPLEQLAEMHHQRAPCELHVDALELARRLDVAEVRIERRLAARAHEERGIRRREAREVEDVGQVRDEERRLQLRSECLQPGHQAPFPTRNSSASR